MSDAEKPIIYEAKPIRPTERIQFNKKVIWHVVLRVALMLLHLGAFIATAIAPEKFKGYGYEPSQFFQVRAAYMAFSMLCLVFAGFMAVILILNVVNVGDMAKIPWLLVMIISDVIWIIAITTLSIFCIIREDTILKTLGYKFYFAEGAFAAAGALGLVCMVLYIVDLVLVILTMVRTRGVFSKVPS